MKFGGILRGWYKKNKRDLPWRYTRDPYKIWLSEVIMQQTRVNQGLKYYLEFVKTFPNVASLAAAHEDEVLKKWQGLGYYSRARNLHQAAKDIDSQMGGKFPDNYEGLLGLKGVGNYTASAIASICFGEPKAVVDGNVSRVVARLFGVEEPINSTSGGKTITSLADQMLDRNDPGTHNQAIMEFGALQCVPVSPNCSICPLAEQCNALLSGRVFQLPVKIPKKKPKKRWFYFYIYRCNGKIILTKRGTEDIWKSLYQFPGIESDEALTEKMVIENVVTSSLPFSILKISPEIKHQLTHRTILARFIHVDLQQWPEELPPGWIKISLDQVNDYPVSRLINRYMESAIF